MDLNLGISAGDEGSNPRSIVDRQVKSGPQILEKECFFFWNAIYQPNMASIGLQAKKKHEDFCRQNIGKKQNPTKNMIVVPHQNWDVPEISIKSSELGTEPMIEGTNSAIPPFS